MTLLETYIFNETNFRIFLLVFGVAVLIVGGIIILLSRKIRKYIKRPVYPPLLPNSKWSYKKENPFIMSSVTITSVREAKDGTVYVKYNEYRQGKDDNWEEHLGILKEKEFRRLYRYTGIEPVAGPTVYKQRTIKKNTLKYPDCPLIIGGVYSYRKEDPFNNEIAIIKDIKENTGGELYVQYTVRSPQCSEYTLSSPENQFCTLYKLDKAPRKEKEP